MAGSVPPQLDPRSTILNPALEQPMSVGTQPTGFSRKEVIQPHLPIRLTCYDFTPVMKPTVVSALLAVRLPTSGRFHSHGVTGGVYKTRERIHRDMLIRDYERFRLHVVELQTTIRTTIGFLGLAPPRGLATLCTDHCITCEALAIRAMRT